MALSTEAKKVLEEKGTIGVKFLLDNERCGRGGLMSLETTTGVPQVLRGDVEDWLGEKIKTNEEKAEKEALGRHRHVIFWSIMAFLAALASLVY